MNIWPAARAIPAITLAKPFGNLRHILMTSC